MAWGLGALKLLQNNIKITLLLIMHTLHSIVPWIFTCPRSKSWDDWRFSGCCQIIL